jgi:AbrB family looped-hinge helix DNA binding protein
MKTTIDKAGRVVIPAAARERAGLKAGTELEVEVEDFSLRLTRRVPGPKIVRSGARLVARPRVATRDVTPVDVAKLVEQERSRWPW